MNSLQSLYTTTTTSSSSSSSSSNSYFSLWSSLLMIEDEIDRANSTQFKILFPIKNTACYYLKLYKIQRFSDHFLTRWILDSRLDGIHNNLRYTHTYFKNTYIHIYIWLYIMCIEILLFCIFYLNN